MTSSNQVLPYADNNAIAISVKPIKHAWNNRAELEAHTQLRQIDEFSLSYEKKVRKGIFLAFLLICFSISCLALFILGVNTTAFFTAGAVLIFFHLIKSGYEFLQEETHTRLAYHNYLATFSFQALANLRQTSKLSNWSKYEIDRYMQYQVLQF